MNEQNILDKLAETAFILPFYIDKMGQRHDTGEADKKQILKAIGYPAETGEQATESLARLQQDMNTGLCPPVWVCEAGKPTCIPLNLAGLKAIQAVYWRLVHEDRTVQAGHAQTAELLPVSLSANEDDDLTGALTLPFDLSPGYYRLFVNTKDEFDETSPMRLVVAPPRCYLPEGMDTTGDEPGKGNNRIWGVPVQLYALRSQKNWGIGDYTDLANLSTELAKLGASLVGINPVNALFPDDPEEASPYRSTNRQFLNHLYIDVKAVPEIASCVRAKELIGSYEFAEKLNTARASEFVDYTLVSELKNKVLTLLHDHFVKNNLDAAGLPVTDRGRDYAMFCNRHGKYLLELCIFQALGEYLGNGGSAPLWRQWPEEYRDVNSLAVLSFATENKNRVAYYAYLQWEAARQLAGAAQACRKAGMSLGLYPDLAVGVSDNGASVWAEKGLFVDGFSIGAPPDIRRPKGQRWGFSPLSPVKMKQTAYDGFSRFMAANMEHAGALRIDHVMGLERLFWVEIPASGKMSASADSQAIRGAFVGYPRDDLMGLIALESHRKKCVIIGEDLGTVREGFREWLYKKGVLTSKILYRQRDSQDGFLPPADYFPLAVAQTGTHDQPSLHGWWHGTDIETFRDCNLYLSDEQYEKARQTRKIDRQKLFSALVRHGVTGYKTALSDDENEGRSVPNGLLRGVSRFLADTPCAIVLVNLSDVLKETRMINVPGTDKEYPNWRLKLSKNIEGLATDIDLLAVARIMKDAGRSG